MGFMPEFSEEDTKIMRGANAAATSAAGEARSSLADRLLPPEERVTRGFSKDQVLIAEDEDLREWERVLRAYLHRLPRGRKHRTTAILVWEWATGRQTTDVKRGELLSDTRRLNKLLASYFGKPRQTFIDGRKFTRVYDIGQNFVVDRKAPHCLELYLAWQKGATVR